MQMIDINNIVDYFKKLQKKNIYVVVTTFLTFII